MELVVVGGLAATSIYFRLTIEKRKKGKIKNSWKDLMQELKLSTKDSKAIPEVKEVEFIENGYILTVKIPTGLELKKIEDAKESIENKFEGLVSIYKERFSSLVQVKIITKDIGKFIFEPVKAESYEIYIGKTFDSSNYLIDINRFTHILVGGVNGTGKSFLISTILTNLIYNSSNEIELHLGQIIKGDLGVFKDCKPVKFASENLKEISNDLDKIVKLIDLRSKHFSQFGIKNLNHYNKHFDGEKAKRIFYVIEELSFFMPSDSDDEDVKYLKGKCWDSILAIVKAGRSSGIHLIALIQRSTVSNLPSDVKSQMCRISFRQISSIDSKNIIECDDAINLDDRECLIYGTNKPMDIVKTPFVDEDFKVLNQYVKEIIIPNNSITKTNLNELESLLDKEEIKEDPEEDKVIYEKPIKKVNKTKKVKKGMIKADEI